MPESSERLDRDHEDTSDATEVTEATAHERCTAAHVVQTGGYLGMEESFNQTADSITRKAGSPSALVIAASVIVVWLISGPIFGFSDTWQLVIDTGRATADQPTLVSSGRAVSSVTGVSVDIGDSVGADAPGATASPGSYGRSPV